MKISLIKSINYAKNSKPSFGVNLSPELEYKYKKLGYETLFKYGKDSDEYKTYEASIKELKRLCPDGTLNLSKEKTGYGIYLQSPYLKSEHVYSTTYKYELLELDGLTNTVSNLAAINNGIYNGKDFKGTREKAVEYIRGNFSSIINKLF